MADDTTELMKQIEAISNDPEHKSRKYVIPLNEARYKTDPLFRHIVDYGIEKGYWKLVDEKVVDDDNGGPPHSRD